MITSQNRWEIVAYTEDITDEDNLNREWRDYGVHVKFKLNTYKWNTEPVLSEYMRTAERNYLNSDYQRLYYARRHREFLAYARSQNWCLYHMWASDYSLYMRRREEYDRVIDVKHITDEVSNRLVEDDPAHLSVRGHRLVAEEVVRHIQ